MLLKFAWTATLFALSLVHTGSWQKAVLDRWSVNCTLFSHPPPYPYELQRLAKGEASWHGVKQLFTCAPDPEWEAFFNKLRAKKEASAKSTTNHSPVANHPVSNLRLGDR